MKTGGEGGKRIRMRGEGGALKMLPTYVRAIPNGEESGDYLVLDLGGTNFRILLIRLNGREAEMTGKVYSVPDSIMQGTAEELFDHIALCMARFMEEQGIPFSRKLPLGFTFSFPCQQEGLTSAKLIRWTKGFKVSGCEGMDVCKMLKEACSRRRDIDIDVVALLNDTVGTLMACAFKENTCQLIRVLRKLNVIQIGVIIGTGTNACYMEQIERIPKLYEKLADDGLPDEIVMNLEWGAFGDDGSLKFVHTKYDREVDSNSINPGKQIAAHLLAAGIATLIDRMERPLVTVGIDGSVYRFHPMFPELLDDKIAELIDENLRYKLMLSEDGCGIGAAVVAAVATRITGQQKEDEPQQENRSEPQQENQNEPQQEIQNEPQQENQNEPQQENRSDNE
ncbi:Hexokinase [Teladorsagia circumcincta]|uniref:Phosphotransferase n=1 Tax=Teladorsagia circumcincta TaxID=45464 RepID=A0A2G9UWK6_TELCI|nr:Hexokinase [Teladorsagia circumcincta]